MDLEVRRRGGGADVPARPAAPPSSSWASSGMLMWRSTRGFPPSAFCRPKSGIGPNCRVLQLDLAVDGADAPSAKPTCEQPGTAEAMNAVCGGCDPLKALVFEIVRGAGEQVV